MKAVTVLCLLFATAFAFPATSDEDSNESELFRPLNKKGVPSVVEVDSSDPDSSDEDSFFFPSFFRPILVNPFPQFNFGGFSNIFPSSMFRWGSLFNMFGRVPEDATVTNATSTVKVIDGDRVTVNVTTYEKDGAVFKYEIVEVVRDRPNRPGGESDGEGEKPIVIASEETTTKKSESDESSSPKNDNNSLDNEIFREEFNENNWEYNRGYQVTTQPKYENYERLPPDYVDLSNDIKVNEVAEAGAMNSGTPFQLPADVEVFPVSQPNYPYYTVHPFAHQYRYENTQNWDYDSSVYNYRNNRIPFANNVQHYKPEPSYNIINRQPFLPFHLHEYQHRYGNPFW